MTTCGKAAATLLFLIPIWSEAFTPTSRIIFGASTVNPARLPSSKYPLRSSSSSSSTTLPDLSTMTASEMKKELESYGISTKSFLEKGELLDALTQARENGATVTQSPTTESSSSSSSSNDENRSERIQEELEKIKSMSVKDMKKELRTMGVSTNSLFEKRELAEALAKARVEGTSQTNDDSAYESYVEYADVEVLPSDGPGPRPKRSTAEDSSNGPSQSNPFGGGGGGTNPFGGGAAGMGGFADILKNMAAGGGAAGGGDGIFDSMGGMGDMFKNMSSGGNVGDMFGGMGGAAQKAQEMMQNPKVREIVMKAQGNPKIMKAVQECMSNPSAFAKYQNDPEVGTLINELKKYI